MHGRLRTRISQHPFHVPCCGEPATAAGIVADLQDGELHSSIQCYIHFKLRGNAVLSVFEYAVAEPMPGNISSRPAGGQRSRRPEIAALLITQEKCFAGSVRDWVVVPW